MKWLCIFVGFVGATAVALAPPEFSPDSQYYIQSGILWAQGNVTYAGSLVGARILAILYYFLALQLFGHSIDAISLALGATFFAYAILVTVWCFREIARPGLATLAALIVIAIGFVWLPWHLPLTEQLAMVIVLAVLLLSASSGEPAGRSKGTYFWVAAVALAGLGMGVRSEFAILAAIMIGVQLVRFTTPLRARLAVAAVLCVTFFISSQIPGLAFRSFTGKAMPQQMTSYFLFYKALHELGDPANGPNSMILSDLGAHARTRLAQPVQTSDARLGVGASYASLGISEANRLIRAAGLETIKARPREFTNIVLGGLSNYVFLVKGLTVWQWQGIIDKRSYDERWHDAKVRIEAIDKFRAAASDRFGGDALFPVASLFEKRLFTPPSIGALPTVAVYPPSWIVSLIASITLLLAFKNGVLSHPAPIAAIYFFSCIALASLCQGFVYRYFMCASLPLMVTSTIYAGRWLSLVLDRRSTTLQTRDFTRNAASGKGV